LETLQHRAAEAVVLIVTQRLLVGIVAVLAVVDRPVAVLALIRVCQAFLGKATQEAHPLLMALLTELVAAAVVLEQLR
jgi:hypothetical protein